MTTSPQTSYLATEVTTASPQKLHLMLIDAAIRRAEQARAAWGAGEDARAAEALDRSQEIVGQMLAAIDREAAPELGRKIAGVYLFLFRSLLEAGLQRDEGKLDEALRVLRIERETWRQLCERLGNRSEPDPTSFETAPGLSLEA